MSPSKILLIRHAEKANADGSVQGVGPEGADDPHSLTVRGWQRAGALVHFLLNSTSSMGTPSLFGASPRSFEPSKRAIQTLSPLADVLGVTIHQDFAVGEELQLAAEILQTDGLVICAWEHNTIHLIGNAIVGNDRDVPQSWPGERFDIVWEFSLTGGAWSFTAAGQHLLAGDDDV